MAARSDPALALRFEVVIDTKDIGAFTGCEGLSAEFEVFEYAEGGENGFVHRLPGRLKFSNVKLTRPLDRESRSLATWFSGVLRERRQGVTATIRALDANNEEVHAWNLRDVVPVRWTGPTFAADGSGIAKETLELAHNGFFG